MARLRLARARAAEIIQEHNPADLETEQKKPSSSCSAEEEEEEQLQVALVPQSRLLLGRRRSSKHRQQRPPQLPPLATPSHAALWLSKWPGLASYSSRVARKRCAKGLPPPALPPVILRQATLQKSRSVESGGGGGRGARGPSADGSTSGGSLSKAPSLPSSSLLLLSKTPPHGRGLQISGDDVFYDARGGSILTATDGGEGDDGSGGNGGMTSELLRALAAEVEQQMAEDERAAAAALRGGSGTGSKGSSSSSAVRKKAESEGGELLDDEDEDDEDADDEEGEQGRGPRVAASDRASALVLSREPGWHSSLFRPSRRLRQGLPPVCETGRRPSMWSLICSLFGKASHDLHSVSVPAHFNEPLTETQRHVEIMQHAHLLDAAATFPPESPARLLAVFGFACSLVSSCVRTSKPFKDLEGGTFEMVADDDDDDDEEEEEEKKQEETKEGTRQAEKAGSKGSSAAAAAPRPRGRRFRALAEKVQHSPPVVAFCVQGERWTLEAHDELHVELGLRGLKMHPRGACRLTFIDRTAAPAPAAPGDAKASTSSPASSSPSSPPSLLPERQPDEYRWNTPAFFVRDIVPSGQPGHMMRVSHKGPFFAKCTATGDAVVAVAAEADARAARAAAARGEGLMSSVEGRYEPGPGRPAFAAEVSGRLDGVVVARVPRAHAMGKGGEEGGGGGGAPPLLGCDPRLFDGGGGRGFSGHAREALSGWPAGRQEEQEEGSDGGGGDGGGGAGGGGSSPSSSPPSQFVLLPLFRGTTAHHRSQRDCGPWGMSPWACQLNDAPPDLLARLPPTDARRRRDVALVERGDGDAADAEKERMEARQRADRAAAGRALREWREARAREKRERRRGRRRRRTTTKEAEEEEVEGGSEGASAPPSSSSAAGMGGGEVQEKEDGGDSAAPSPIPPTTTTAETAAAAEPSTTTPPPASASGKKQREERPRPFGKPRWFHSVPGTDVWGNPYSRWVYSGGYWEARESGQWPRGTRDPYC